MRHLILTISLIFGATAASAGSHFKDYGFPKKDCHEMFAGIGGLLEEADKEWAYLEKTPEGSPDALEHAAKIQWYVGLAANYTAIFEAFCSATLKVATEEGTSVVGQVEKLIEKKLQQLRSSSDDTEITEDAEDTFVTNYFTFPDNFTTNLKGSRAFLQFNIGVSTQYDKIVMENVELHQLALRSEILGVVSEFPAEDLRGMKGLSDLAYSIRKSINNRLEILEGFGGVEEVFFTGFNIR